MLLKMKLVLFVVLLNEFSQCLHGADIVDVGVINYIKIYQNVSSLYNVTANDVKEYNMYASSSQHRYPARYGLDGDVNTMAFTGYSGNHTWWGVTFKRKFEIQKGDLSQAQDLTLLLINDNETVGRFLCNQLDTDWLNKLCIVDNDSTITADSVRLEKPKYGFYLSEAVIYAQPHIKLAPRINASNTLNMTMRCWQVTLQWQIEDSCCSSMNISSDIAFSQLNKHELIYNNCLGSRVDYIYVIFLTNNEMTVTVSVNYTTSSITPYIYHVDIDSLTSRDTTPSSLGLVFTLSNRHGKSVFYPDAFEIYAYDITETTRAVPASCQMMSCQGMLIGLIPDTMYKVYIISHTMFNGQLYTLLSDKLNMSTLNCAEPDGVEYIETVDLLPQSHDVVEVKIRFKPGSSNCVKNATYHLYYTEGSETKKLVCSSVLYYCSAVLLGHTWYKFIIEVENSWGLTTNTSIPPWLSPTKAPSEVTNIQYIIKIDESPYLCINWDPPQRLNGVITLYEVSYKINRTSKTHNQSTVTTNVTHLAINNTDISLVYDIKVRAKTLYWGPYSSVSLKVYELLNTTEAPNSYIAMSTRSDAVTLIGIGVALTIFVLSTTMIATICLKRKQLCCFGNHISWELSDQLEQSLALTSSESTIY